MSPELARRLQLLAPHQKSLVIRTLEKLGDQASALDEDAMLALLDEALRIPATILLCELQDAATATHTTFIDDLQRELIPLCPAARACLIEGEASGGMTRDIALRYASAIHDQVDLMKVPLSRVPPSLMQRVRARRSEKRTLIEREMRLYSLDEYEACLRVEDREGMLHVREHADT